MTLEDSGLISGHPLPVLASRACISSVRTGDCHSPCYHRAFAHAVLSAWSTPCPTLISGHILQISATQTSQAPGYTSQHPEFWAPDLQAFSGSGIFKSIFRSSCLSFVETEEAA